MKRNAPDSAPFEAPAAYSAARQSAAASWLRFQASDGHEEAAAAARDLADALDSLYAMAKTPGWRGFLGFARARRLARGNPDAEEAMSAASAACRARLADELRIAERFPAVSRHAGATALTVMAERRGELLEAAQSAISRLASETRARTALTAADSSGLARLAARIAQARGDAAMSAATKQRWDALHVSGHARKELLRSLAAHLRDCGLEGPLSEACADDLAPRQRRAEPASGEVPAFL